MHSLENKYIINIPHTMNTSFKNTIILQSYCTTSIPKHLPLNIKTFVNIPNDTTVLSTNDYKLSMSKSDEKTEKINFLEENNSRPLPTNTNIEPEINNSENIGIMYIMHILNKSDRIQIVFTGEKGVTVSMVDPFKISEMIERGYHDFLSCKNNLKNLREYAYSKKKTIIKYCDKEIIQYFFPDITESSTFDYLLKYSKTDDLYYFISQNEEFLQKIIRVADYKSISDMKIFKILCDLGLKINDFHFIDAVRNYKLDRVEWIFSQIPIGNRSAISAELEKTKTYSKYPEVVMWMRKNGMYAHYNLDVFDVCNGRKPLMIDARLPDGRFPPELVVHQASINVFSLVKEYDVTKLSSTETAHILYYAVIYSDHTIFEKYITKFVNLKEAQLLISIGGLDAMVDICNLAHNGLDNLYTSIYTSSKTTKFMHKYSDDIVKKCYSLDDLPCIKMLFLDLNMSLKFHMIGKTDLFFKIYTKNSVCGYLRWENVDYVYNSEDENLINIVSKSGSDILDYPEYNLSKKACKAIVKSFCPNLVSYFVNRLLIYGMFDMIDDLLRLGAKFNKYSLNYSLLCGYGAVRWLSSSEYYNFPITKEYIDECIFMSPKLQTELEKLRILL